MVRKYKLKLRADSQRETRKRIVEATVHLHQTIGSSKTTISAIAEKAGVERLTVYRHFPDERSLFTACTSHYLTLNPLPDPSEWERIEEPRQRLRTALTEIYAFHVRTEPMFSRAAHDLDENPVLREVLAPYFSHWQRVHAILCAPWKVTGRTRVLARALIGHAISFQTWRSLVREQGLKNAEAVDLLVRTMSSLISKE